MEERGGGGFGSLDELYGDLCKELRDGGLAMDLCGKIKVAPSDLSRVQLFLKSFPETVEKFTNSIQKSYQKKNLAKAQDLVEQVENSGPPQADGDSKMGAAEQVSHFAHLTQALALAPWDGDNLQIQQIRHELKVYTSDLKSCIDFLINKIISAQQDHEKKKKEFTSAWESGATEQEGAHQEKSHVAISSRGEGTQSSASGQSSCKEPVRIVTSKLLAKATCSGSVGGGSSIPERKIPAVSRSVQVDTAGTCAEATTTTTLGESEKNKTLGNNLVSEIYFHRAASLFSGGLCENALLEFGRAIIFHSPHRTGFPSGLTFTRIYNIGHSLKVLGFLREAETVLHRATTHLRFHSTHLDNETKGKETLKLVQLLKQIKTETSQLATKSNNSPTPGSKTRTVPPAPQTTTTFALFGSPNPRMPNASDALQLHQDQKRGRFLTATRKIPPGATLIIDDPYAWSLYPQNYLEFCQHCCCKIGTGAAIPCHQCSAVLFCSVACWESSARYHKWECVILKNLDCSETLGEMGVLCYRTIAVTAPASLLRWAKTLGNQQEAKEADSNNFPLQSSHVYKGSREAVEEGDKIVQRLDQLAELDPTDFSSVLGLCPNTAARPGGDIIKRTVAAIYLTLSLRFSGYFSQSSSTNTTSSPPHQDQQDSILHPPQSGRGQEEQFIHGSQGQPPDDNNMLSSAQLLVAALFLRLSQGLTCNAYGVNGVLAGIGESVHNLGGALYPTVSAVNHSCNPNVFRLSAGKKCIVRTIQEIQEGQEVCDSYGPLYSRMERKDRRRVLKCQYFFDCDCQACEEDWPTFQQLAKTQSSGLEQEVVANGRKPAALSGKNKSGQGGGGNGGGGGGGDGKRLMKVVKESEKLYKSAKDLLLRDGNINKNSIQHITSHIATLQKNLPQPHKLILEAQEALKFSWNLEIRNSFP